MQMCAFCSDIIDHQLSLFPEPILDGLQSLDSRVILDENILLSKPTAHVVVVVDVI